MSDNHWNIVKDHVLAIVEAVETVKPGEVLTVYCSRFVARKFGNLSDEEARSRAITESDRSTHTEGLVRS